MRVRILGRYWNLRLGVPALANAADCDPPDVPAKEIRIGPDQEHELEAVIHEVMHAADWHKDEAWVGSVAADLAAILKRIGYRKGAP